MPEREQLVARFLREDESRLVHEMVRSFSMYEPFDATLRTQLNLIGTYLKVWLEAVDAIHLFNNPNIGDMHWMRIDDDGVLPVFSVERIKVNDFDNILEIHDGHLLSFCRRSMGAGSRFWFVPFSHRNVPFGHFILAFAEGNVPSDLIFEKLKGSMVVLQSTLKNLLYNHFPITGFTYLPSFQTAHTGEAAILFCDIRNSTRMTEVTRLADEKFTELMVVLLKSFLEYASRIISVANIGRIHSFTGDGLVATFGEYITAPPEKKASASCALGLLTAKLLVEGFDELWKIVQTHGIYQEWLRLYNEDLDLRLGVGVNYGKVRFDWFGISLSNTERGKPRGFNVFTAVGDQMNFCARLCSVANQPLSALNVLFRSPGLPVARVTAPVIASRTVTYRVSECLRTGRITNPLVECRTDFEHKGKGHPMPAFEIGTDQIGLPLLGLLNGIHDNRLRFEIETEAQNVVAARPAFAHVATRFRGLLDDLIQRGHFETR